MARGRVTVVILAAAFACAVAPARAGDPPAPSSAATAETRAAWDALDSKADPVPDEGGKVLEDWMRAREVKLDRFAEAFGRSDWDAWALPADREIFTSGLLNFHWGARRERRFDDARRALDTLERRLPDDPEAFRSRHHLRADLLLSMGDVPGALAHCLRREGELTGYSKALDEVRLGDARNVTGDAKGAAAAYAAAEKAMAEWDGKDDEKGAPVATESSVRWAHEWIDEDLALRRTVLGKPTTSLKIGSWIGAPTVDWTHLRGKVVVVLLCRKPDHFLDQELADLDRLAMAMAGKPFQALAIVHPSGLPDFRPSPGARIQDHVAAFRTARKLSVPFAVMDDSEFARITTSNHTLTLVADAKRTIVHASSWIPDDLASLGIAQFLAERIAESVAPPK